MITLMEALKKAMTRAKETGLDNDGVFLERLLTNTRRVYFNENKDVFAFIEEQITEKLNEKNKHGKSPNRPINLHGDRVNNPHDSLGKLINTIRTVMANGEFVPGQVYEFICSNLDSVSLLSENIGANILSSVYKSNAEEKPVVIHLLDIPSIDPKQHISTVNGLCKMNTELAGFTYYSTEIIKSYHDLSDYIHDERNIKAIIVTHEIFSNAPSVLLHALHVATTRGIPVILITLNRHFRESYYEHNPIVERNAKVSDSVRLTVDCIKTTITGRNLINVDVTSRLLKPIVSHQNQSRCGCNGSCIKNTTNKNDCLSSIFKPGHVYVFTCDNVESALLLSTNIDTNILKSDVMTMNMLDDRKPEVLHLLNDVRIDTFEYMTSVCDLSKLYDVKFENVQIAVGRIDSPSSRTSNYINDGKNIKALIITCNRSDSLLKSYAFDIALKKDIPVILIYSNHCFNEIRQGIGSIIGGDIGLFSDHVEFTVDCVKVTDDGHITIPVDVSLFDIRHHGHLGIHQFDEHTNMTFKILKRRAGIKYNDLISFKYLNNLTADTFCPKTKTGQSNLVDEKAWLLKFVGELKELAKYYDAPITNVHQMDTLATTEQQTGTMNESLEDDEDNLDDEWCYEDIVFLFMNMVCAASLSNDGKTTMIDDLLEMIQASGNKEQLNILFDLVVGRANRIHGSKKDHTTLVNEMEIVLEDNFVDEMVQLLEAMDNKQK